MVKASDPEGGAAAFWTIAYLGLTVGVQMADRGLLSLLSPAIQASFAVGDALMGALHGIAGILVASALAIPLAKLADRYSRKQVLLWFVGAWALLTALGALAPWFPVFFVGRAAAGVTEFALVPVIYSMLPDLAGPRLRVAANLGFAALVAVGAAAGFAVAGPFVAIAQWLTTSLPLAQDVESWRIAMLLLASLGLPLIVLGLVTADPPRGLSIGSTANDTDLLPYLRREHRTVVLLVLAAGGIAVAVQGLLPLLPLALGRRFSFELGMLGEWLGVILLASSLVSLGFAAVYDKLMPTLIREPARPMLMLVGAALATPCVLLILWAESVPRVLVLVAGILLATGIANAFVPTIIQDVVPPPLRARAFAGYSLIISVFLAAGPVLMGAVSDLLLSQDLLAAITWVAVPSLALAALCAGLAAWTRSRGALASAGAGAG